MMQDFFAGFPFVIPTATESLASIDDKYDAAALSGQPLDSLPSEQTHFDDETILLHDEIFRLEPLSPELLVSEDDEDTPDSHSSDEPTDISTFAEEDVWQSAFNPSSASLNASSHSWDAFYNTKPEPNFASFGDVDTLTYDAALSWLGQKRAKSLAHRPSLISIARLGLGRESTLFPHEQNRKVFAFLVDGCQMSGYSQETFHSIVSMFADYGQKFARLRKETCAGFGRDQHSPASMAVRCDMNEALVVIEGSIIHSLDSIVSLLQLDEAFRDWQASLDLFGSLLLAIDSAVSDIEVISRLANVIKVLSHRDIQTQAVVTRLLNRAAGPWMRSLLAWLRLSFSDNASTTQAPSFVLESSDDTEAVAEDIASHKLWFQPLNLPPILSQGVGQLAFETGCSLRLLHNYCPDHPLLALPPSAEELHQADFEWGTCSDNVVNVAARAKRYEYRVAKTFEVYEHCPNLLSASHAGSMDTKAAFSESFSSTHQGEDSIADSLRHIEDSLDEHQLTWTKLLPVASHDTIVTELSPQSVTLNLTIDPWVSAQYNLASRACLWLLLKRFKLRNHLNLLQRYQLLTDGRFISRLCDALFSPDLPTTERRSREYRTGNSGLKLGHRKTWPPASSELRLALTGILKDNYFEDVLDRGSSLSDQEIPGKLSFAIREMTEVEIKRCVDPDSVFALDFLRIQYRAPPPLDMILTTTTLSKYDVIFRLLLRTKRTQYAVDRLIPQAWPLGKLAALSAWLKLRQICRHFVSSINQYFSDRVRKTCAEIHVELLRSEEHLISEPCGPVNGVFRFKECIAAGLDRLRQSLFLRKKYAEVLKLVDDILNTVLSFAKTGQEKRATVTDTQDLLGILNDLTKKISIFIRVGHGLVENDRQSIIAGGDDASPRDRDHDAEEDNQSAISSLLLRLQMNDFYNVQGLT